MQIFHVKYIRITALAAPVHDSYRNLQKVLAPDLLSLHRPQMTLISLQCCHFLATPPIRLLPAHQTVQIYITIGSAGHMCSLLYSTTTRCSSHMYTANFGFLP